MGDKSDSGYKTEVAEALVVYFAVAQPRNTEPLPPVHYIPWGDGRKVYKCVADSHVSRYLLFKPRIHFTSCRQTAYAMYKIYVYPLAAKQKRFSCLELSFSRSATRRADATICMLKELCQIPRKRLLCTLPRYNVRYNHVVISENVN